MRAVPPVRYDLIRLGGGLDQVTPALSLPSGIARRAANFECSVNGGYTRISGYERFDGRPRPSDAIYTLLAVTFSGTVAVGDTLVGATSAASGYVIAVTDSTIAVTATVGTYLEGEDLNVSATAQANLVQVTGISSDGLLDASYKNLAADYYRASITAIPGSGSILGVCYYNDVVFAFRNNSGGTAADLYKSTATGWTQVTLPKEISFGTGTAEISDGDTVDGATSGASATVARVVLETGTWGAGTATGRLILTGVTGTFQSGENLQVGAAVKAVSTSTVTQISFLPNGRFETVIANFGGGTTNYKVYGCDGVNRAFEFDGTTLVPISSGMATDTPEHISFHKQHLFLSFGASLQFSALGDPYQWTPLLGAGELAMNAPITNLLTLPGDQTSGALAVYTRRDTNVLYGTSSADFSLATLNSGTGGLAYTAQNMDVAYVLDDRGVISLGTALSFGNFLPASLTMNINPFVASKRALACASSVQREKGQYRVYFNDGTALYVTIVNGKVLGSMPMQFVSPVLCFAEGDSSTGQARQFFGSTEGFVYEMDVGSSFDGSPIAANLNLIYNAVNSPRVLKRFRRASVEMTGDSYAEIQFAYELAYSSAYMEQPSESVYTTDLRSSFWDDTTWDNFVFDAQEVSPTEVEVVGTGENIGIRISSESDLFRPFTVNSVILHYTPRRGIR
jgi:hypothetical protein